MKPFSCLVALAATLLCAGCASAPEQAVTPPAVAEPTVAAVQTAPSVVVNLNEEPQETPTSTVVCRQMLRQASNVIQTRCMTVEDWKKYERLEALHAQEILRLMQGGR